MNNIPQSMNYIQIEKHGDPEVLKLHSMPVPEPGPGEVLIKVAAAGVNRPDMMQRKGLYPPPSRRNRCSRTGGFRNCSECGSKRQRASHQF